jgi:uncharacterized protein involved in outer membrane biogenesis
MPLLRRTIQVHSIVIDHPRIMAETNAQGIGNIEALLRKEKSKSGSASKGTMSGASPSAGGADQPLVVTGTVESPQVRPSVSKMVTNVAKGLLHSFLKKKTK